MKKRNNAGAIASNAGDDFHLLWACRKILQTLDSDTNLTAVSVEGPSWYDSVDSTDEEKLYSIDLAEYYGGNNFWQADSKTEIISQIGHWNISNVKNRYNDLIMHIREMMLPEQVKGFPMGKEYVLSVLGATNYQMFPAPSEINRPLKEYIKRDVERSFIVQYFGEESESVICLQATAGAGKTTFVSNLRDYLPEASVTVFYDCYGGGSYLFPAEHRHLPDVAIPQICNTLAVECGTDLLIGRPFKEYEWWRFLNDRLKNAVNYVKRQNPQAVVVIIIDAADNSMIAADTFKEPCFLQGILNQPFPKGGFFCCYN